HLKISGERQLDLEDLVADAHFDMLAETLMLHALESDEIALASDRLDVASGKRRRFDGLRRKMIVGEDDGWRPLRQKRVEETHLRAQIFLDGRVIIHMVATEIGEGTGSKLDAIETALVETMRRSFHGGMGDAFVGKFGQHAMQLHRIR